MMATMRTSCGQVLMSSFCFTRFSYGTMKNSYISRCILSENGAKVLHDDLRVAPVLGTADRVNGETLRNAYSLYGDKPVLVDVRMLTLWPGLRRLYSWVVRDLVAQMQVRNFPRSGAINNYAGSYTLHRCVGCHS